MKIELHLFALCFREKLYYGLWSASFVIPKQVIKRLEQLISWFLWAAEDHWGFHRVLQDTIMLPYKEKRFKSLEGRLVEQGMPH